MAFRFPGDEVLVVTFENDAVLNEGKSKEAGRPVFDDREICKIRFPGDKQKLSVFPADAFSANAEKSDGTTEPLTYAERFQDAYQAFRKDGSKAMSGTPLEELPFLTAADRSTLKAFNIYTAEQLQSLEGENLKALGPKGREYKNQAQAYIESASDSAGATRLAAENGQLKERIAALEAAAAAPAKKSEPVSEFDDWEDARIKEYIEEKSGAKPRGNPSHATLVSMAEELKAKSRD